MGFISTIKGWFGMVFSSKVKEEFHIEPITAAQSEQLIGYCLRAYQGYPDWVNTDEHIKTINFAKALCSEAARLTTLGIGIHTDGGTRAEWLQQQIDNVYYKITECVEYSCACGTVILKPNLDSIDLYLPNDYVITDTKAGEITGVVFINREFDNYNKKYYTRLEYHRFDTEGKYIITNHCKVGNSPDEMLRDIAIEKTPWVGLAEEAVIANLTSPLFAVLRTPRANNVDISSPVALPIIADAIEELKDLDIAYSRYIKEIYDSSRIVLLDKDRVLPYGELMRNKNALGRVNMPDYINLVDSDTSVNSDIYHEINPSLNTDVRLSGINFLLSQIGYKIGFSNGYFVFDEASGIQTATGVEAEQQRTVQFIKDMRDKLESCMNDLIYALNAFADLYSLAPAGSYETVYDFSDITYNFEEDRQHHYSLVMQNRFPLEEYYVRFLKYSRDEAKALIAMAKAEHEEPKLFGEDE